MSRTVSVEVDGKTYVLASDEDGPDLAAVALLVNERLAAIREASPTISTERSAILAALNLGDELLRERAAGREGAAAVAGAVAEVRERLAGLLEEEA